MLSWKEQGVMFRVMEGIAATLSDMKQSKYTNQKSESEQNVWKK